MSRRNLGGRGGELEVRLAERAACAVCNTQTSVALLKWPLCRTCKLRAHVLHEAKYVDNVQTVSPKMRRYQYQNIVTHLQAQHRRSLQC